MAVLGFTNYFKIAFETYSIGENILLKKKNPSVLRGHLPKEQFSTDFSLNFINYRVSIYNYSHKLVLHLASEGEPSYYG